MRPGRNRLVVLTHRTARHGRHAVFDVERDRFWHKRRVVIAGAGRDRVFSAGGFVTLRGSATVAGDDVDRRWRIVSAPPGARARLHNARSARPRARRDDSRDLPDPHAGHGSQRLVVGRHGHRQHAASQCRRWDGSSLRPTTAAPSPWTTSRSPTRCGRARAAANLPNCEPYMSWAVINRQDRDGRGSRTTAWPTPPEPEAPGRPDQRALQGRRPSTSSSSTSPAAARRCPTACGSSSRSGVDTSAGPSPRSSGRSRSSASPESPAGSSVHIRPADPVRPEQPSVPRGPAAGPGEHDRLSAPESRPEKGGGWFEFVFGDQVAFQTDAAPANGKITMKVGDKDLRVEPSRRTARRASCC